MHISKLDTSARLCRCCLHHTLGRVHVCEPGPATSQLHSNSAQNIHTAASQDPIGSHLLRQDKMDHALAEAHIARQHETVFEG